MNNKVTKGTKVASKVAKQETSLTDGGGAFDFDDQLAIEPSLKKEILAKGLVFRWINGAKHKANYGYDSRRWTPYKREKTEGLENNSYGFTDSEGFIRRGDLILAVRKKEIHDLSRERIRSKTRNLAGEAKKAVVEQIKAGRKEVGMDDDFTIHEGYEDPSDSPE